MMPVMLRNRLLLRPLFLLLGMLAIYARAEEPRDWKLHPAIIELRMPIDLYALGDVHGDYDRAVELLNAAHLIAAVPDKPEAAQWAAGQAVLVCTGDFIDKSDHALPVIALLRAIQPQAEKAGGRVIITLGNHEAEFLAGGGTKKKSAEFAKELKAAGWVVADVAAGRDAAGIGQWLRDLPVGAKVGDWFFCHAGNTGGRSLAQLRHDLETGITAEGFRARVISDPNSLLQARMHPRQWWDWNGNDVQLTEVAKPSDPHEVAAGSEARLRRGIEALDCKHLVIGHQPGKITFADGSVREAGAVFSKFNGLIYLIDTGMSRGANSGRGALLKVHQQAEQVTTTVIYADGKTASLEP